MTGQLDINEWTSRQLESVQESRWITCPTWLNEYFDLNHTEFMIASAIWSFSHDGHSWFKGTQGYLARLAGCSIRSVRRAVQGLLDKQVIVTQSYTTPNRPNGGNNISYVYRINYDSCYQTIYGCLPDGIVRLPSNIKNCLNDEDLAMSDDALNLANDNKTPDEPQGTKCPPCTGDKMTGVHRGQNDRCAQGTKCPPTPDTMSAPQGTKCPPSIKNNINNIKSSSACANNQNLNDVAAAATAAIAAAPSYDNVKRYIEKNHLLVDVDKFWDTMNGQEWIQNGEPVYSWRALLKGWDNTERNKREIETRRVTTANNYRQAKLDDEFDENGMRKVRQPIDGHNIGDLWIEHTCDGDTWYLYPTDCSYRRLPFAIRNPEFVMNREEAEAWAYSIYGEKRYKASYDKLYPEETEVPAVK